MWSTISILKYTRVGWVLIAVLTWEKHRLSGRLNAWSQRTMARETHVDEATANVLLIARQRDKMDEKRGMVRY
jgi:hypothetical protein